MKDTKYLPTPFSYSQAVAAGDYIFLAMHRGFGPDFIDDDCLFMIGGIAYRKNK